MSSLLYQLSYNLISYADKGFAPIYAGHEPVMLLLHQSALKLKNIIFFYIFLALLWCFASYWCYAKQEEYLSLSVSALKHYEINMKNSLRGGRTLACNDENIMS